MTPALEARALTKRYRTPGGGELVAVDALSFEVKSGEIVRRGRITTTWMQTKQQLRTSYRNGDFIRAVTAAPAHRQADAEYANGRLSFERLTAKSNDAAWKSVGENDLIEVSAIAKTLPNAKQVLAYLEE